MTPAHRRTGLCPSRQRTYKEENTQQSCASLAGFTHFFNFSLTFTSTDHVLMFGMYSFFFKIAPQSVTYTHLLQHMILGHLNAHQSLLLCRNNHIHSHTEGLALGVLWGSSGGPLGVRSLLKDSDMSTTGIEPMTSKSSTLNQPKTPVLPVPQQCWE